MGQTGRYGKTAQLEDFLASRVIKRSVSISGHLTSVSLEQPFWDELNRLARQDEISLSALINQIDKDRKTNLSSALRLYVLYILQSSAED